MRSRPSATASRGPPHYPHRLKAHAKLRTKICSMLLDSKILPSNDLRQSEQHVSIEQVRKACKGGARSRRSPFLTRSRSGSRRHKLPGCQLTPWSRIPCVRGEPGGAGRAHSKEERGCIGVSTGQGEVGTGRESGALDRHGRSRATFVGVWADAARTGAGARAKFGRHVVGLQSWHRVPAEAYQRRPIARDCTRSAPYT